MQRACSSKIAVGYPTKSHGFRQSSTNRSATFGSRFSSRRVDRAERSKAIIASASSAELVKDLASKFEIPGHVESHPFRGCVTSWKQASGDEVLYIRPDAVFDKSKPISGGIPHCFPQFGPGEMQQHGFARNLDWEVVGSSADPQPDDRDPEIEIALIDNEYTKKMWPHDFMVAYSISLHGETLKTDMRVLNKGSEAFDFTAALHSYFEVAGVENAKVNGLKGLEYLDKTEDANNPPKKEEDRDSIAFTGPVDSVYLKSAGHVELDVGTGAAISIDSKNWSIQLSGLLGLPCQIATRSL
eukprot:jgi/Picre1/32190/NNA_007536.t1